MLAATSVLLLTVLNCWLKSSGCAWHAVREGVERGECGGACGLLVVGRLVAGLSRVLAQLPTFARLKGPQVQQADCKHDDKHRVSANLVSTLLYGLGSAF